MSKPIWITWAKHRRTREITQYLELDLFELITNKHGIIRYILLLTRTFLQLVKKRPSTLFIQNPSLILALFCVIVKPLFRYKLIVDAHNEAVEPYAYPTSVVKFLAKLVMRFANTTIVTNNYLTDKVIKAGGRAFILPDKIPEINPKASANYQFDGDKFRLTLIATFAKDEPIEEIIQAVNSLEDELSLYVTGNPDWFKENYHGQLPNNIVFTGFLTDRDYWRLLLSSNAAIDLSSKDNCLVCGAYEGVAAEIPLILSDSDATKDYFSKGAVYTRNDAESIGASITECIEHEQRLRDETRLLKRALSENWNILAQNLKSHIV